MDGASSTGTHRGTATMTYAVSNATNTTSPMSTYCYNCKEDGPAMPGTRSNTNKEYKTTWFITFLGTLLVPALLILIQRQSNCSSRYRVKFQTRHCAFNTCSILSLKIASRTSSGFAKSRRINRLSISIIIVVVIIR